MIVQNITDIEEYLRQHENKGLLRFITCGSVDDGKSTLIGRLLHDTKMIYEDQLAILTRDSKTSGTRGGQIDLALLVDGLQSEREQGITIDVAYRYFSTDKRTFIIADTPGHEQYTRNMATGASTAQLAIILIDARQGVLTQTRRHSFIGDLLGIRHFVIAINKMDLVDYDEAVFERIKADYLAFADELEIDDIRFVPLSALEGENVTANSEKMPWYSGEPLLTTLETIKVAEDDAFDGVRLPVQYVNRPNLDFRGFSGTLSAGDLRPGTRIKALPSGVSSTVKAIVTWEGEQDHAVPGEAITVTLDDEIDISRGDLIVEAECALQPATRFEAHVVWMNEQPLEVGKSYEIKIGHLVTVARVSAIVHQIDVNTLEKAAADSVPLNGIALCRFELSRPAPMDAYGKNKGTGSFVLIDRLTNLTVGAGMVREVLESGNIVFHHMAIDKQARAARNHQKPAVVWFTGLSGSGKSTVADALEKRLFALGMHTYLLDGDNVRHGLCKDLGFSEADRTENIRRVGEVAKLMTEAGLVVLVSFIAPLRQDRKAVREMLEAGEFIEVYVNTPLDVCEARDPKGLYEKARRGEIKGFTGIDSPYEPPESPEIALDTSRPLEECVDTLLAGLRKVGVVR